MHEWVAMIPRLSGEIGIYQPRCMFEGINHGGMNQKKWDRLNFEGVCGLQTL